MQAGETGQAKEEGDTVKYTKRYFIGLNTYKTLAAARAEAKEMHIANIRRSDYYKGGGVIDVETWVDGKRVPGTHGEPSKRKAQEYA